MREKETPVTSVNAWEIRQHVEKKDGSAQGAKKKVITHFTGLGGGYLTPRLFNPITRNSEKL